MKLYILKKIRLQQLFKTTKIKFKCLKRNAPKALSCNIYTIYTEIGQVMDSHQLHLRAKGPLCAIILTGVIHIFIFQLHDVIPNTVLEISNILLSESFVKFPSMLHT